MTLSFLPMKPAVQSYLEECMVNAHMLPTGYCNPWLVVRQNCLVKRFAWFIISSLRRESVWFTQVEVVVGWMQDGRKLEEWALCMCFGCREAAAGARFTHLL